jgi:hypothetical protein
MSGQKTRFLKSLVATIAVTTAQFAICPAFADVSDVAGDTESTPVIRQVRPSDVIQEKFGNPRIALANPGIEIGGLTPDAREVARLLGVLPQVEGLVAAHRSNPNRSPEISDAELAQKVYLLEKIMGGVLEVRVVADRIDRELAWSWNGKHMLEANRQRNLNYLFTANFMQGGILGIVAGGMFLHRKPVQGAELLLLGSSIGLGLSVISFVEMRSGSKPIDGETNVLADVFQLPYTTEEMHKPEVVIKYMTSVPPGSTSGKTRVQELKDTWQQGRYLGTSNEMHLKKLAAVRPAEGAYHENIGLMGERIRMLYDCQWKIEQLDGSLLDLIRAID